MMWTKEKTFERESVKFEDLKGIPQEILEDLCSDDKEDILYAWMDYVEAFFKMKNAERHGLDLSYKVRAEKENLECILDCSYDIDVDNFIEANKFMLG